MALDSEIVSSEDARLTANRFALVTMRKGHRRRPDRLLYDIFVRPEGHPEDIKIACFMHKGDAIQHGKKLARRAGCEFRDYSDITGIQTPGGRRSRRR